MSNPWRVRAILHEIDGRLELGLVASREFGGQVQNTTDVIMVADVEDAHQEALAYCATLGVDDYDFEDRRRAA